MNRRRVLEAIAWAEDECGSLITGGPYSRRDVMRCVRAGLAKSVGLVIVMEGDFAREPEQWREGFKLTEAGRAALRL